jgi:hypothetical protein
LPPSTLFQMRPCCESASSTCCESLGEMAIAEISIMSSGVVLIPFQKAPASVDLNAALRPPA